MELVHNDGRMNMFCKHCRIYFTATHVSVKMDLKVEPKHSLSKCKVHLPISADFFVKECTMTVDDRPVRGKVIGKTLASDCFDHHTKHGQITSKVHCNNDIVVFELGNVRTSLNLTISLLGCPQRHRTGVLSDVISTQLHIPSGMEKPKYGKQAEGQEIIADPQSAGCCTLQNFHVTWAGDLKDFEIASPTHKVIYSKDEPSGDDKHVAGGISVSSCHGDDPHHQGMILMATYCQDTTMSCLVERNCAAFSGESVVLFSSTIQNADKAAHEPCEFIFFVDCSGSMEDRMPMARACLKAAIHNLPLGDRFNILPFGRGHYYIFPESIEITETTLDSADVAVASLSANMGTTLVGPAIRFSEALETVRGLKRVGILITDGAVKNPEECGREARQATRIQQWHGIGIGADASMNLLKEITAETEGTYGVFEVGDMLETSMNTFASNMLQAALSSDDVEVSVLIKEVQGFATLISSPKLLRYGEPFLVVFVAPSTCQDILLKLSTADKNYTLHLNLPSESKITDNGQQIAAHLLVKHFANIQGPDNAGHKFKTAKRAARALLGEATMHSLQSLSEKANVLCSGTSMVMVHEHSRGLWLCGEVGGRKGVEASQLVSIPLVPRSVVGRGGFGTLKSGNPQSNTSPIELMSKCPHGPTALKIKAALTLDPNTDRESAFHPVAAGWRLEAGGDDVEKDYAGRVESDGCERVQSDGCELVKRGGAESLLLTLTDTVDIAGSWSSATFPTKFITLCACPDGFADVVAPSCSVDRVWCTLLVLIHLTSRACASSTFLQLISKKALSYLQCSVKKGITVKNLIARFG